MTVACVCVVDLHAGRPQLSQARVLQVVREQHSRWVSHRHLRHERQLQTGQVSCEMHVQEKIHVSCWLIVCNVAVWWDSSWNGEPCLSLSLRHVSFVDCPGHDILMATMLNGAAVMDAALLLIGESQIQQVLTRTCFTNCSLIWLWLFSPNLFSCQLVTSHARSLRRRSIWQPLRSWS